MGSKNMKRLISMLLSIVLFIGMIPLQAYSLEVRSGAVIKGLPNSLQTSWVNPLYNIPFDSSDTSDSLPFSSTRALTYYSSPKTAAKVVKASMLKRQESIVFGYLIPVKTFNQNGLGDICADIFDVVCKHTGVPEEGDYIRWSCYGWSASAYSTGKSSDGAYYKTTITFSPRYLSNASHEKQVTKKVSSLLNTLSPSGSDYKKLLTVYNWMCANIRYDYDNLNDNTYYLKHSAYAAIVQKKAVCQGYALLLYRLALKMGIDCRIIVGLGNGGNHAWNIVKLGSKYYNLDSTWDASYKQAGYSYNFFLKSNKNFGDHVRAREYTTSSFKKAYPMGSTDYKNSSVTKLKAPTVKVSNVASTGKIRLKWNSISGATKYKIYRATSKTGTYKLIKTTTGTSYTDTTATAGKTYYYKIKAIHKNSSANSNYSKVVSRICKLARPSVRIVLSKGDPKISWGKISGAQKYYIYRATSKNGSYKLIKSTTKLCYTDTSARAGKYYYYKVRAVRTNSAGNSVCSSVKYIKAK